jgi:hypothetical protein
MVINVPFCNVADAVAGGLGFWAHADPMVIKTSRIAENNIDFFINNIYYKTKLKKKS